MSSTSLSSPYRAPSQMNRFVGLWRSILESLLLAFLLTAGWAYFLRPSLGLDTTDESLYLLQATNLDRETAWLFPADWHLSAMFQISGQDISRFRILGSMLLTIAGIALARSLLDHWRLARPNQLHDSAQPYWLIRLVYIAVCLVIPASTHFYYIAFLRTPSYNTLNAVGILIVASGLIRAVDRSSSSESVALKHFFGSGSTIAAGLLFAAPGRPSTVPLGLLVVVAAVAAASGPRAAVRLGAAVASGAALGVVLLFLIGPWPRNPFSALRVFWEGVQFPALVSAQTLQGGLIGQGQAILSILRFVSTLGSPSLLGLVLVVLGILAPQFGVKSRVFGASTSAAAGLLLLALVLRQLAGPLEWLSLSTNGVFRVSWAFEPVAQIGVLLVVASLGVRLCVWAVNFVTSPEYEKPDLNAMRPDGAIVCGLIALAMVFGFGSSNGTFAMSAHVAVLYVAASIALLGAAPPAVRSRAALSILASVAATLVFTVQASYYSPYRLAPMSEQSVRVTGLPGIRGEIYVDEWTHERIVHIQQLADFAQLSNNGSVIVTVSLWPAFHQVVIGQPLPSVLMLTLYGYENSLSLAAHNLDRLDPEWLSEAWILSSAGVVDGSATDEEFAVLALLANQAQRDFPSDYSCVAWSNAGAVFRPVLPREAASGQIPIEHCPMLPWTQPR